MMQQERKKGIRDAGSTADFRILFEILEILDFFETFKYFEIFEILTLLHSYTVTLLHFHTLRVRVVKSKGVFILKLIIGRDLTKSGQFNRS